MLNTLIPNFISSLYALALRGYYDNTNVENDDGSVNEQEGVAFEYRVQRKVGGINILKQTLECLDLNVVPVEKTKCSDDIIKTYIALDVRENNFEKYNGLTTEQITQVNTLIATGQIGFNLAKAIVTGSNTLNEALNLDERAVALELEAANQNDDEVQKVKKDRAISKAFIQAQLDEVFAFNVEINSMINNSFNNAITKLRQNQILTLNEEKTLFAFIEHTYGSIENYLNDTKTNLPNRTNTYRNLVHDILTSLDRENLKEIYYKPTLKLQTEGDKPGIIDKLKDGLNKISDNEKLALIREIDKVRINVKELSNARYTDDLQGDAKNLYEKIKDVKGLEQKLKDIQALQRTLKNDKDSKIIVSPNDVQNYGKLQLTKQAFGEITKAANGEANIDLEKQFQILDGQDVIYPDRLRSAAFSAPKERFSKMQVELLLKHNLDIAAKIGGLDFNSLEIASYPPLDETNLTTIPPKGKAQSLLEGREYNLKFLEDGHIIKISKHLADKAQIELNNIYNIAVGAAASNKSNKDAQEEWLRNAMFNIKKDNPVALPISDNSHWIGSVLLPMEKGKFVIIGRDSLKSYGNIKDITPTLQNVAEKLGLEIEKNGDANYFNMSVDGQQHGDCCGFATACNMFSIMKAYDYFKKNGGMPTKEGGSFDADLFKEKLLEYTIYRRGTITLQNGSTFTGTILYGNKPSTLTLEAFIKQFGGLALQEIASDEAMKSHLGENKVEYELGGNEKYFGNKANLEVALRNKNALGSAQINADQIKITYNKKSYAVSQPELYSINDVKFHKGLDKLLNGGVLDVLLRDERKKVFLLRS